MMPGPSALSSRGFDPNTVDPKGLGGLYLALREPSPKAALALIEWPKTDVEIRTDKDESPLMMAALKGYLELARRLIERGADVNKTGWTPLRTPPPTATSRSWSCCWKRTPISTRHHRTAPRR